MTDIVQKLRTTASMAAGDQYVATHQSLLLDAAAELERLRAAGDALAKVWGCWNCEEFGENVHEDDNGNPIPCPAKTAYIAWQEARRG